MCVAMKYLKWILISLTALVILGYGGLRLVSSRTFQFFGGLTHRVPMEEKRVALTFDDGPTQRVEPLLALLDQLDVKATFFLVGSEIEKSPQLAAAIVQAGHQVGSHSWSHRRMVLVTPGFVRDELSKTDAALRAAGYTGDISFRPPYGKKFLALPWVLRQQGRRTITWDIEPESDEATAGSSQRIAQAVLNEARPGSIILLHPMYSDKALEALPVIVEGLRARGYEFMTVDELIASASAQKSGE